MPLGPREQVDVFELQSKIFRVEAAGVRVVRDRFLDVPEPGENFRQATDVRGRALVSFRHRPPSRQRVIGPLQQMKKFAEVLAVLSRLGSELDRAAILLDRLVGHLRLPQ